MSYVIDFLAFFDEISSETLLILTYLLIQAEKASKRQMSKLVSSFVSSKKK